MATGSSRASYGNMDLTLVFLLVGAMAVGLSVARLWRWPEERDFLQGAGLYLLSIVLGSGVLALLDPVWAVPLAGIGILVGGAFLLGDAHRVEGVRLRRLARTLEAVGRDPREVEMAVEERLDELEEEPRFSTLSGLAALLAVIAVLAGLAYDLPLGYLMGGLTGWLPLQDWVRGQTRSVERRNLEGLKKGLGTGGEPEEAIES